MKLRILLQGKAQALADKVQIPTLADFTIDGQVVLPTKCDRVTLRRLCSADRGCFLRQITRKPGPSRARCSLHPPKGSLNPRALLESAHEA